MPASVSIRITIELDTPKPLQACHQGFHVLQDNVYLKPAKDFSLSL